jgi:membrane peptidoglycan carboxypeptidase
MSYLSPDRTLKRKVQEAMLALWLERQLSKQEILARYLNTAFFGDGVYGVDAAAKRYFAKPARSLTLGESAMLIGLLRAPTTFDPRRNLETARDRASLVLDQMIAAGVVSRGEAETARRAPANLRAAAQGPVGAGYFIDAAGLEAARLVGSVSADLTLRTTLDPDIQAQADDAVRGYLAGEGKAKAATQAALIAMRPDGAILGMVGGRDYGESQFNRATLAERQPGSLFKFFVYLAALKHGLTPDTMAVDRPVEIGNWRPDNFDGRYFGRVPLRAAFAHSLNSVAAQLGQSVGVPAIVQTAKELGIRSNLPDVPSLAHGSAEVNLMEMVRAYAAVAFNDGRLIEPHAVSEIRRGERVYYREEASTSPTVVDASTRSEMLDLLSAVVRNGTGRAAQTSSVVGGKTGTTQENRDAWFIGFTPELIVGVWVGNDDHSPMKGVTGGDLPARIWRDFVTRIPPEKLRGPMANAHSAEVAPAPERPAVPAPAKTEPGAPALVTGVPEVLDTATLAIDGRPVRLLGVDGLSGTAAWHLGRYIRRRPVICTADQAKAGFYRCTVDGRDLSAAVLFNGGGRANADATPDLQRAESAARSSGTGVWAAK